MLTKLKPTLLNLLDLKSLLIRPETQIVSCPRLGLSEWNGENFLVYVQIHETLIIYDLRHPVFVVDIPQADKSLQINLYRMHNIPLVHPILKKSFRCSIQE